ncbi:hypothetical protein A2U01_0000607 [Trifolium medium]|uniref:Uncharacterized protein n=1 Tax=Trifolium medium TaxID=97028 RepID=A0A392LY44_9FABA|nr:hypothetical protein [Trifolium medium]
MVNGLVVSMGYLDIANNTLAELMALYHGLKIASKERNSFHYYAATIANIQDLLKLEWDVSSNEAKFCIWESPPLDMQDLLLSNAMRVPYPKA